MSFEQTLEKYATLAVNVGVNIQPGQILSINAPLEAAPFVRLVTEKAYKSGAKHVYVDWNDEVLTRLKFDLAPEEAFSEFPAWKAHAREELAKEGAAFMSIYAENPDLLKGVDAKRIASSHKVAGEAMEVYRGYLQADKVSWCVISVPTKEWAAKVFPDVTLEKQEEKLWDAIFQATRANLENPVESWKKHDETLHKKVDYLNEKHYKALHYTGPGTDLTIELPEKHVWAGASSLNEKNVPFMANIPTEEVFTLPLKTGVNGQVSSTKPLAFAGNIIDNFTLTFENGRIVEYKADIGEEALKHLVETDEGSHFLGEVALVPHDSPISNTNILFYNMLFDENASCHLAIGHAHATNLIGGKTMTKEELAENGANSSIIHEDFMIGSAKLNIDGITADGTHEPIFCKGNWAF
ncbi:aminopeptidase [Bacillus cereus]|uniref:aminopeptidase n=1 Tax=unclassified Bacillus (in: firmicutes) TaxID=185979 RepID=UPI00047DE3A7|nr:MULTISPECIES: aminopeptidase [unclassified Bacillus (in: firmicutes)]PFD98407.1 aminopeptidase [Bacillus sp. AFS023182]PGX94865.1 aminopeptidase [Bacillus cereus]